MLQGADPASLVPRNQTNIATSLAPYIVLYDAEGNPFLSSATLDGKIPVPPKGVFASAKQYGEDIVTWQPRPDVRTAIVVRPYFGTRSGFVLAGRSMREVERREERLEFIVGGMWIAILFFSFLATLMFG